MQSPSVVCYKPATRLHIKIDILSLSSTYMQNDKENIIEELFLLSDMLALMDTI